MRAKVKIDYVESFKDAVGNTTSENLIFRAVCKDGIYPADGSDEDNTFARWTPAAELKMSITNPDLFGKFAVGEKYYLDFTKAE